MKKSILASSIAAAVFSLGAVTGAQAAEALSATTGSTNYGIGDVLLVPYFSAQAENATLLSLINTDTQSGKAVKVRFRGAANSDDVFDFQVFLSPRDVWTANIAKGADGLARLTTSDNSCTKPSAAVLNATPFQTGRLNTALTGDALANGTREGYIEIIGMADVPPHNRSSGPASAFTGLLGTASTDAAVVAGTKLTTDSALFTAIKHVSGVAPCTGTAFTNLDTTSAFALTNSAAGTGPALGLTPSTGGLMANWTIVNTVNAAAYGGEAIALSSSEAYSNRVAAGSNVNIIYAPQIGTATGVNIVTNWSADPLFLAAASGTNYYNLTTQALTTTVGTAPVFAAGYYDLPDLSTPLDTPITAANAAAQVTAITSAFSQRASIVNEFAVESAISGSTDWVFSMPTRRYSVAMAYSKITATDDGRRWNSLLNSQDGTVKNQFQLSNTSIVNGLICVSGANPAPNDREERSVTSTPVVVVSPSTVAGSVKLCGETSVLSFNQGAATTSASLKANVALTNIDVTYSAGWATMSVSAGTGNGNYPVAGGVFQRAQFGAQGFGIFRPFR